MCGDLDGYKKRVKTRNKATKYAARYSNETSPRPAREIQKAEPHGNGVAETRRHRKQ